MKLLNEQKIGLSMAVFLASDDYDYDPRPNAVSATGLLKSVRQTILSKRVVESAAEIDISSLAASTFGNAVHDGVEKAWSGKRYIKAMRKLGYPESVIQRIKVNPQPEELLPDTIPVYIEQRREKEFHNWIVTGKFDFVGDGVLEDHKTTGVFTYIKSSNAEKFRLQGSIYRWLNQDIITGDYMLINYVFTDWSALRAKIEKDKGSPPHRMMSVKISLKSLEDTETFIRTKLKAVQDHLSKPEAELPLCSKEELWQDATVYKYYRNPATKDRSTKNFDNFAEAQMRLVKDGSVGVIDIVKGEAKACRWCPAVAICSQAKQMIVDGILNMEV